MTTEQKRRRNAKIARYELRRLRELCRQFGCYEDAKRFARERKAAEGKKPTGHTGRSDCADALLFASGLTTKQARAERARVARMAKQAA